MKVKIPKEIRLLTHTYKIRSSSKETRANGAMALSRHFHQDIIIDKATMPRSEYEQAFFHEVLHVIERHFSMNFTDEDIDRLAEGLVAILFDNLGIELDWSAIKEE